MTPAFDMTDVPKASPETLALAMRLLIEEGRVLVLMRGPTNDDRRHLEKRFWENFEGATQDGVVSLVRLWSLVDVFKARRLQSLLLDRGYALLADAARVAAEQRLNIDWGFNPQRVLAELVARRPYIERFRPSLKQFCFSSSDPIQQAGGAGRSGATAKPPNALGGFCLESARAGCTCANSFAFRLARSAATPCVDLLDLGASAPRQNGSI